MDVITAIGFEAKTTAFKTNVTLKHKCNARKIVYVQLLFLMFSFLFHAQNSITTSNKITEPCLEVQDT